MSTNDNTYMRPVNPKTLHPIHAKIIRDTERGLANRQDRLRSVRARNRGLGGGLLTVVVGVYLYSMLSVRQETISQDLDAKFLHLQSSSK